MQNNKTLWTTPFGFRESFIIIFGIIFIGLILQLSVGNFNFYLIHQPVNYGVALCIVFLCFVFSRCNNAFCKWLCSIQLATAIFAGMLILSLIMGFIPQIKQNFHTHSIISRMGIQTITSSWQFVLLYTVALFSIGTLSFKRIQILSSKNIFFFITHCGLFLALLGAGLGASDMQRFVMHVNEKETEWRVFNENDEAIELPIAIELHDFDMETYAPKIVLIERKTGIALPKDNPHFFQVDTKIKTGKLGDFNLEILTYYHNAVWAGNGEYKEYDMVGASPAVKIKATNSKTGESQTGWVTTGNLSQFVSALYLDNEYAIVMTKAEPKSFISDITVITKEGENIRYLLEVNKPLRVGNWIIYQYGYDDKLGDLSPYSSFELVYDPWLNLVYLGLIMLCIGSILLIWQGKKEK